MTNSILVLWDAMGIVFVVVSGICNDGQLCYYNTNIEINRVMVGIILFLHSLTMVLQVVFARKTHQYENKFHNDISIRLGHDWVLTKRKPLQSCGSTGSFHTSSRRSSVDSIQDDDAENAKSEHSVPVKTIVVMESDYRKFPPVPVAEPQMVSRARSKSIPNMRKHPEMLEIQPDLKGGTVVSIYSDSEGKKTDAQKKERPRLMKHSHRRSKSDGGRCTERSAGQVGQNGTPESNSLDTITDVVTPRIETNDKDADKSSKKKHKHKKHKKAKKSRVEPEPEDQSQGDRISAWDGKSEDSSKHETNAKADSPNTTLIKKSEKLQADQEELQKQQRELLMKQEQLLTLHQHHMELGYNPTPGAETRYNPPPKYSEAVGHQTLSPQNNENVDAIPLPNQAVDGEDDKDDDVFA